MACTGHVLIGTDGEFLHVDFTFGSIMRSSPDGLIGRAVIDVTAPADRDECASAIFDLRRTLQPFTISKRLLRDDGSLIWVTNTVSITVGPQSIIMATIDPIEREMRSHTPGALLDAARFAERCGLERRLVCDADLVFDPVWSMMLAAYIIEAEGLVLDGEMMAARSGMSAKATARWLLVLIDREILELELGQNRHAPKAFRLTARALQRFEHYLTMVDDRRDDTTAGPGGEPGDCMSRFLS